MQIPAMNFTKHLALTLALGLIGCGKSDDGASSAKPATAAPAASEALPALRASAPQGTPAAEAVQAINQSLISSDPQENLRVLNQLLDGYIMSRNTVPADLEELVKAKMLSRIPPAPPGKKFAIDRKTNRVVLADQ
jgi:hypothetical protein